jgi:hypothetical protein
MPETFWVFYSWQSDLPRASSQDLIRRALHRAAKSLNAKHTKAEVVIDEATRGEPGSPDIFQAIREKISKADVFVGDVSTITKASESGGRAFQNPNVLIELGYALAELGYPRMILLCSRQFTNVPADLPFDIDRRRVTPFSGSDPELKSGQAESNLAATLAMAIDTVRIRNPRKARLHSLDAPEAVKRVRDADLLETVLSCIHGPSLLAHTEDVPYRINQDTLDYWYGFDAWVSAKVHLLADQRLRDGCFSLRESWAKTIEHTYDYDANGTGRYALFYNPGDWPLSEERQSRWDATLAAAAELRRSWVDLCAYVRDNYVELDLDKCSRSALERHQRLVREVANQERSWRARLGRFIRILIR